jgi:hypothetical protein
MKSANNGNAVNGKTSAELKEIEKILARLRHKFKTLIKRKLYINLDGIKTRSYL